MNFQNELRASIEGKIRIGDHHSEAPKRPDSSTVRLDFIIGSAAIMSYGSGCFFPSLHVRAPQLHFLVQEKAVENLKRLKDRHLYAILS
jgi:hypothetical protein